VRFSGVVSRRARERQAVIDAQLLADLPANIAGIKELTRRVREVRQRIRDGSR
jgi:hypothetical protein